MNDAEPTPGPGRLRPPKPPAERPERPSHPKLAGALLMIGVVVFLVVVSVFGVR